MCVSESVFSVVSHVAGNHSCVLCPVSERCVGDFSHDTGAEGSPIIYHLFLFFLFILIFMFNTDVVYAYVMMLLALRYAGVILGNSRVLGSDTNGGVGFISSELTNCI